MLLDLSMQVSKLKSTCRHAVYPVCYCQLYSHADTDSETDGDVKASGQISRCRYQSRGFGLSLNLSLQARILVSTLIWGGGKISVSNEMLLTSRWSWSMPVIYTAGWLEPGRPPSLLLVQR